MSPSANMMFPLIALSLIVVSTGMSEEGYDNEVYEFNRANDVADSSTKRAVYYKPYQKERQEIENRPENYREYDSPTAEYKYRWKVEDSYSGNFFGHAESRDDSQTVGEYYVMLPDGRVQRVRYSVDGPYGGFKAEVSYEGKTKIPKPKPKRTRPQRPKNIFPTVRERKPGYERVDLRAIDSVPTFARSTPSPLLISTLTPQFSHRRPTFIKFQEGREPKRKKYSYKTLPEKHPETLPAAPAGPRIPSQAQLSPNFEGGPLTSEKTTSNESPESKAATPRPPPTPYTFSYGPPGFQEPPPPRASSTYYQNPPPDVVRRFSYRPVESEEEEEKEEGGDNEDGIEVTENIHGDHREVVQSFVVDDPQTSSPETHAHPTPKEPFRDSEIKTLSPLHYSLSPPYPPLHHPYLLQDPLYPLPSVKRYTFKEIPDEDEGEDEADVDTEDDGAEAPEESFEENNESELGYKDKLIDSATVTAGEPNPAISQVSREERSREEGNDNIRMTSFVNQELPESEIWGYRLYLP